MLQFKFCCFQNPELLHMFPLISAAKSLQSCPTLCNPIDISPPGSAVPGILQARTLEWVAISFSNAWKWKVKVKSLSRVRLFATPWIAAHQAPPPMGFSRQEYWSGVPLPSPEIKSVNLKGNQSWIFIGSTDGEAETNILATWCEELTYWKGPWCWERLKAGGEGDDRGWDGWMGSPTQWTWVWVDSGSWWWTGRPGVLRFMGSQRVGHDWATELNWECKHVQFY